MSASTTAGERQPQLNYGLDDVPKPWPKAVGLGLQHVLTMFGATVAVPFILSPILEFDAAQLAILISSVFICSGLATIVQVRFGSRLPIVQGVSFAFLGPFIAVAFFVAVFATLFLGAGFHALLCWLALALVVQFFRDPPRPIPADVNAVLSPADGRIVKVEKVRDPYADRDALPGDNRQQLVVEVVPQLPSNAPIAGMSA